MKETKDIHYFKSTGYKGEGEFSPSLTTPGQGFRMCEIVKRMQAGAPPPVGRDPVYIDPKYGVDPLARMDLPIEEMALVAENARKRYDELVAMRDAFVAEQAKKATPAPVPPPTPDQATLP